jgi:protein O-GlcNAc transferase
MAKNRYQQRAGAKLGENSGKLAARTAEVAELLATGVAHHQAGRLAQAETCYRQVLAVQSDQADALQLLGLLANQAGQHDLAVDLIRQAIRRNPANPAYFSNLGAVLTEQGKLVEAVAAYREAIRVKPNFAEAHCNLGSSLHGSRKLEEAIAAFRQAIRIKPGLAEAHANLGKALNEQGKFDEAIAAYREAICVRPDFAAAYFSLGDSLRSLGRLDEAIAACRQVIRIKPDLAEAHANLGDALRECGKLDEAIAACREAIRIKPGLSGAHCNLGAALYDRGKLDQAVAAYGRALAIQPDNADALVNLVIALTDQGRLEEAVACYERALVLRADLPGIHDKLGFALFEYGLLAEALTCYRRALARRPDATGTLIKYGVAMTSCGQPEAALESFRRAVAASPADAEPHSGLIFALNFDPAATTSEHQAERSRWDERHARRFTPSRPHENDRDPDRRLRIGYVSPYFCSQAATYAFGGVIMCRNAGQFEVVCYSDTAREDHVTGRLAAGADKWHRTADLDDDALAALIRADRIDILVDLVGHMRGHRLLVFARKPAPIQVTAWGEPTGTGLAAMDYLFADPTLVLPHERALFAERVVDLPNFLGYWTPDPIAEPRALSALERGYVTFSSFNRFDKIQEPVLTAWGRILNALPGARLVLKEGRTCVDAIQRERMTSVFATAGVAAERLTFLGALSRSGHFDAYHDIDIALDPFPHGGGMTTLDALWMGVPVVTFAGQTVSSRLASATLSALELKDYVGRDRDAYVDLAIAKASDLPALARLRPTLRGRIADSAFGDPARYTSAVETAYRKMWRRWCGLP